MKRRGDDQKFLAEVLAIGTECDIALLTVKDDAFWQGVSPLELGPLPRLQVRFYQCCTQYHHDAHKFTAKQLKPRLYFAG